MRLINYPVLIFILLFTGCTTYDAYLYEVIDMKAANADNAGELTVATDADSISKKAYAIQLEYTMQFAGESGEDVDPHESGYQNKYNVTSFNVYCLDTFDMQHLPGTSINNYFLVSRGGSYTANNTIEQLVHNGTIGIGRGYSGNIIDTWTSTQYLILMQPPVNNGNYRFVIDIEQSNNTHMIDTIATHLY